MSSVKEISEQLVAAEEALKRFFQTNAGVLAVVLGKKQRGVCLHAKETQAVIELTSRIREFGEAMDAALEHPETREQGVRAAMVLGDVDQKGQ